MGDQRVRRVQLIERRPGVPQVPLHRALEVLLADGGRERRRVRRPGLVVSRPLPRSRPSPRPTCGRRCPWPRSRRGPGPRLSSSPCPWRCRPPVLIGRTGRSASRQAVADLHQGRRQGAGMAGHPAGEPVGVILAASAEPEHDVFAGDVEHIGPDRHGDPVAVILAPVAGLHGRPVGEVEQERHELDDRHQQHVPVLAVADLVRHDALDLLGLEQVEDPLRDHDPHVVGVVPVGEGIGCPVVDQAEPGHLHALLGRHAVDELPEVLGQLVDREPRELVDPAQREVHQPGAEHELEDDDPRADGGRDGRCDQAELGHRDQHQAQDAVQQHEHSGRADEEVGQREHPRGQLADAVVGSLVAGRLRRVERRIAERAVVLEPIPFLGHELERIAIGLDGLVQLARRRTSSLRIRGSG